MKKYIGIIISISLLVSVSYSMSVKNLKTRHPALNKSEGKYPFLEFLELKQFPLKDHKIKFDLSGLAEHADGSVYAISDKPTTPYIYKVDWGKAKLEEYLPFGITDKLDIEAIDICGDDFYISNEKNDKFYIVKKKEPTKKLDIDTSGNFSKNFFSDGNQGFEGMAIDCDNQIMYATKQFNPRFILTIDLKDNKILKKWNIPQDDAFDFADAKYQNGYLYLLERIGMVVTKVDVKTEKVIAKYSYQHMEKKPGYLFGPANYPLAEALMLTKNEVWIGFDNNGLKTTAESQKELGLKGRAPLIMRFKRPDGF